MLKKVNQVNAAYKAGSFNHVNNGVSATIPDQAYSPRDLLRMFVQGNLPPCAVYNNYDEEDESEDPQWVPPVGAPPIDVAEKLQELRETTARRERKPVTPKPVTPKPETPKPETPKPETPKPETLPSAE